MSTQNKHSRRVKATRRTRYRRSKLSTTISRESKGYLDNLVKQGAAATVAEAIDLSIEKLARLDNRYRLARDTAAYFNDMSPEEAAEEAELESALGNLLSDVDFDD